MTALRLHKRKYDSFSRPGELKSLLSSESLRVLKLEFLSSTDLTCTRTR
jgi:hypothetical protein